MGLSIHYSGTIKDAILVDDLITEVADICQSLNWTYTIIKEPNADQLNGFAFHLKNVNPSFSPFYQAEECVLPLI